MEIEKMNIRQIEIARVIIWHQKGIFSLEQAIKEIERQFPERFK